ncbi:MAG TPA: ABC transporter permease [bacterium]|nr:ABC transporter permease [bacterium]
MRTAFQLLAFLRRDWRLARSSTLGLAWQAVAVVFATPTLYYLGRLVRPETPSLARYGGDYFAFAILGIACSGLLASVMGACAAAVRQEQVGGTLDVLLTLPASLPTLAVGASLWPMLLTLAQTALYVGLGVAVFHVDLGRVNLLGAAVILGLGTVVSAALGLLSAAFVLLFRRPDPLTGIVAGVGALFGGVFYPVDVLPSRARILAEFVPLTHALHGVRLAVLRGAGLPALLPPMLVLLAWCLVAVPASLVIARWALHEARRSGAVSGYG